jgi:hypothetical protein
LIKQFRQGRYIIVLSPENLHIREECAEQSVGTCKFSLSHHEGRSDVAAAVIKSAAGRCVVFLLFLMGNTGSLLKVCLPRQTIVWGERDMAVLDNLLREKPG